MQPPKKRTRKKQPDQTMIDQTSVMEVEPTSPPEISIPESVDSNSKQVTPASSAKDLVADIINGQVEQMEEVDPEFLNDFLVETREHIENIEMNILALETAPDNMEIIHSLFRSFHTVKGLAGFVNQNLVRTIAHQTETQLDKCRKGETKVNKYFVDLILASSDFLKKITDDLSLNQSPEFIKNVEQHLDLLIKGVDQTSAEWELKHQIQIPDETIKVNKIGEILVGQGLNQQAVEELLDKKEEYPNLKLGQIAVKEKKAEVKEVLQSLRIQEKATNLISPDSGYSGYTRVATIKIDNLADYIGELVIMQSQIEQSAIKRFGTNDQLVTNLLRMEKISKEIQNISMSLRMISLKSTFQKINRIGRDTIAELSKNVTLFIQGEETEIDRGIAEKLLDPLVHLVKNAISHGIEKLPEERVGKGKPAQGIVKIEAYSKRGNVYIEVSDDGRGIDLEKIHQKALQKELLDPSKTYTDDEILNVIFLPGFSTAENVDNVSGRGVGLDVVKTEISKIGGKIELNNQPGEGCSFILKIPINLAVINGTIVDMLGAKYILPTLFIKQILKPEEKQWISVTGNQALIRVKDNVIPLIPIRKIFGLTEEQQIAENELVIVLELEQKLKALPVRNIIDRREIVVKPLGSDFSHLEFVSGASILGDGSVSLILDIESLFKLGENSN